MPQGPDDRDLGDDPESDPYREVGRRGEAERERLEDVELAPNVAPLDDDEAAELPRPEPRRDRLFPLLLAGAAVLGAALLAAVFFLFRTPSAPDAAPAATKATPAPPSGQGTPATPGAPLPRLEDSDGLARTLGATLSSHPEFTRWLARSGLVRTVAAVATNVADGESPRPHLEFLAPAVRFRSRTGRSGSLAPDPAGFKGYDAFGDAVASVDAAAAASAYRAIEPLLDEAHRELGHPEGRFRESLDRAIAALLAVPVLRDDAALVPHATLLRWADPAVEALSPAQKQLLRTGPRNVRLVQAKLREFRTALAATPSP